MDFFEVMTREDKKRTVIYPDFRVCNSNDLMVKGKYFYAIWDEEKGLWCTDAYRVPEIIDAELLKYRDENFQPFQHQYVDVETAASYKTKVWDHFLAYCKSRSDNAIDLDTKIIFADTKVKRTDYCSHRLSYSMYDGPCDAYDRLIGRLYDPEERQKLEWAIGSIISGDSKKIQKFIVLYGEAGTGKSTVLNIIQKLFEGYYTTFDAKSLTNPNNQFSTEVFRTNPLVAIQHDGDLSRIEDNSKLNSIISHEEITINEKHKALYTMRLNAFLFMGSNKEVKITDSKSGIIRRLIDVRPSYRRFDLDEYNELVAAIDNELGAIAYHCYQVYKSLGRGYYNGYKPMSMMYATDTFFNFVESYYDIFNETNYITANRAFEMYKQYCDETDVKYPLSFLPFREQLKDYFYEYHDRTYIDGKNVRSCFKEFKKNKFDIATLTAKAEPEDLLYSIKLDCTESLLDKVLADCPAQYANQDEYPNKAWDNVTTTLKDLNTKKLHYVRPPKNLIIIDFDLKDSEGNKSKERNLAAASEWPMTYTEYSKGGGGIHLHYWYNGDVSKLSRLYSEDIEIKVFTGKSSLRRRLSYCNNIAIATLDKELPQKEEKKVANFAAIEDEEYLRNRIKKALRKEVHPSTKPNIDYIWKILEDYYASGKPYSVIDMRPDILAFAMSSTHQSDYCVKLVNKMKFQSENYSEEAVFEHDKIVFYDVEVFPNLFLVNWKLQGETNPVLRMINPTPEEIGELLRYKLVGFNNRRYDNHILYARYIGYTNLELFDLSQRIVSGSRNAMFGEAYNLSYTDIYDYCAKKQSLKLWEIELGIHHQELGLPWDQPVDPKLWVKVAEYCDNDVLATEAVWNATQSDFTARKILAEMAGKNPNCSTNQLTTAIIFGNEKKPELVYTDLATGEPTNPKYKRDDIISAFPGYTFERGDDGKWHNMYLGTDLGFGGYVYAEPGMYKNVALLDVASLHPHSTLAMNCFGEYTKNYADLIKMRIYIKHKDYDSAKQLFGGKLAKYLDDPNSAKQLSQALKIAINSVYGMTSATYDNAFRDTRNKNNIVALRGALFMRQLQEEVTKRGFTVAHIKTDSIKIPDATPEIISFCMEFAKKYGYTFEHEATYSKMCLVNHAVYIAKYKDGEHAGQWTATGAQFAHPYVYKTLFSKEPIIFSDLCETKSVQTALYLDFNENLSDDEHQYHFVGKVGLFCPIISGKGGGLLLREKDGKYSFATGAKDYRWKEAEIVESLKLEDDIDMLYFKKLADDAVDNLSKYGDFEWLVSDDEDDDLPPFDPPYRTIK